MEENYLLSSLVMKISHNLKITRRPILITISMILDMYHFLLVFQFDLPSNCQIQSDFLVCEKASRGIETISTISTSRSLTINGS